MALAMDWTSLMIGFQAKYMTSENPGVWTLGMTATVHLCPLDQSLYHKDLSILIHKVWLNAMRMPANTSGLLLYRVLI